MNKTNFFKEKKNLLMLVPIVLAIIFVFVFFGLSKKASIDGGRQSVLLEPDTKAENKPENKLTAYEAEKLAEQKQQWELENSKVKGTDFYKNLQQNESYKKKQERIQNFDYDRDILNKEAVEQLLDKDGNPILDANENPIYIRKQNPSSFAENIKTNMEEDSRERSIEQIINDAAKKGELQQHIKENEELKQELAKKYGLPAYSRKELLNASEKDFTALATDPDNKELKQQMAKKYGISVEDIESLSNAPLAPNKSENFKNKMSAKDLAALTADPNNEELKQQMAKKYGMSVEDIESLTNDQRKKNLAKKYDIPSKDIETLAADLGNEMLKQEFAKKHKLDITDVDNITSDIIAIEYPELEGFGGGVFLVNQEGKRTRKAKRVKTQKTNLIKACVHGEQTVVSGGVVRMRLLEKIKVDNVEISANTVFYGTATIGSNRLQITVKNLKYGDFISPVVYTIYDNDAMIGLNLPDNLKAEANKQFQTRLAQGIQLPISSIGTVTSEITSAVNATTQVAKQLFTKNASQIKVKLKANYQLFIEEETKEHKKERENLEEQMDMLILDNEPKQRSALEQLFF